jgi:hypothetical protein
MRWHEITETSAIRVRQNPSLEIYETLCRQDPDHMVRALVTMDNQWVCWPGHQSEHWAVIEQLGMREVIPLRLYGLPGGHGTVEITETRHLLPSARFDPEWLGGAIQRFVARRKIFRSTEVVVF